MSSKLDPFSFVAELPTCKIPRHCCKLVKVTTLYFVLAFLLLTGYTSFLVLFVLCHNQIIVAPFMDKMLDNVALIPSIFLVSLWLITILVSFLGICLRKASLFIPLIISQILITLGTPHPTILYFLKHSLDISQNVLVIVLMSVVFCLDLYFLYVTIGCAKYVKLKKETELYIRRQKMFDEVCWEMLEEEQQAIREKEREHTRASIRFYEEHFSISDDSSYSAEITTYYETITQPNILRPQHNFYDPDEPSF